MTQPNTHRHPPRRGPVSRAEFERRIHDLWSYVLDQEDHITTIGEAIVSAQDDVNAVAQAINDLDTKVNAADSQLQTAVTDIQAWIAANPTAPNLSGLQSAVSSLGTGLDQLATDVQNAASIVPAPPAGG